MLLPGGDGRVLRQRSGDPDPGRADPGERGGAARAARRRAPRGGRGVLRGRLPGRRTTRARARACGGAATGCSSTAWLTALPVLPGEGDRGGSGTPASARRLGRTQPRSDAPRDRRDLARGRELRVSDLTAVYRWAEWIKETTVRAARARRIQGSPLGDRLPTDPAYSAESRRDVRTAGAVPCEGACLDGSCTRPATRPRRALTATAATASPASARRSRAARRRRVERVLQRRARGLIRRSRSPGCSGRRAWAPSRGLRRRRSRERRRLTSGAPPRGRPPGAAGPLLPGAAGPAALPGAARASLLRGRARAARSRRRAALAGLARAPGSRRAGAPPRRARSGSARRLPVAQHHRGGLRRSGAGAPLVGRSRYCDHPPEVLGLPSVGGYADSSIEAIIALSPTLVVGARGPRGRARRVAARARDRDVFPRHRVARADRGHAHGARAPSSTRHPARSRRSAGSAPGAARSSRPSPRVGAPRVRAALLYDTSPLFVAGPGSFPDELIRLAGGGNVITRGGPYPSISASSSCSCWIPMSCSTARPATAICGGASRLAALRDAPGWRSCAPCARGACAR